MHPSKVHQSTAKKSNSGLQTASTSTGDLNSTPTISASKVVETATAQSQPEAGQSSAYSPLKLDFQWTRPDTVLSPEAQRIMESVRGEAARIKSKMMAERAEQERQDRVTEVNSPTTERKIAKPRGMIGRYSDVHKQEFKKMDSIAGHVSTWKNKFHVGHNPLKRSKSKADLDEFDEVPHQASSSGSLSGNSNDGQLEYSALGKRLKQHHHDDASSARPVSRDSQAQHAQKNNMLGMGYSKSSLPSVMTTPTKASLARSTTFVYPQTTKVPTLGRSKSFKDLGGPAGSRTEGSIKYVASLNRTERPKSVLHKSQPEHSKAPLKLAGGTHLPLPTSKAQEYNETPLLSGTPSRGHPLQKLPSLKRVNITPTTKSIFDSDDKSASPSKIPVNFTPMTKAKLDLAAASPSPSKMSVTAYPNQSIAAKSPEKVTYPPLTLPNPLSSNPTQSGDFTFPSIKTARFGPATSGLTSPTIRQVRPSGIATPVTAFDDVPSIPHGMSNKKRRRADSEDEDVENIAPQREYSEGPSAKRFKTGGPLGKAVTDKPNMAERKRAANKGAKSGIPKAKGKGILSLSRLNMLARPKNKH